MPSRTLLRLILSVAFLSGAPCGAALGQAEITPRPKVFLGLTTGNLQKESDPHLQSFLVMQGIVQLLADRLSNSAERVDIGDRPNWRGRRLSTDDWLPLAKRGYTHYLIALPTRPLTGSASSIEVKWALGQITSPSVLGFSGLLEKTTRISIPNGDAAAVILDGVGNPEHVAIDLANAMRQIFFELNNTFRYFVDCFGRYGMKAGHHWEEAHAAIAGYLSRELQEGKWSTDMRLGAPDVVSGTCRDGGRYMASPAYRDANLFIRGDLWLLTSPRTTGKQELSLPLELNQHLTEKRNRLLDRDSIQDQGSPSTGIKHLKDFCVDDDTPLTPTLLRDIRDYVAAHGLGLQPTHPAKWSCNAR